MGQKRTNKHRRVWVKHNGPIPKDDTGRSMEIHHIDGNHANNDISNLMLVTLDEHYEIHRAQGDYAACYLMAVQRMNKSPEEISENSRLAALKRIAEGTSPFQDPEFLKRKSIETRQRNLELSAQGLNP